MKPENIEQFEAFFRCVSKKLNCDKLNLLLFILVDNQQSVVIIFTFYIFCLIFDCVLRCLTACHTVVREKNGTYRAESPDELALVEGGLSSLFCVMFTLIFRIQASPLILVNYWREAPKK